MIQLIHVRPFRVPVEAPLNFRVFGGPGTTEHRKVIDPVSLLETDGGHIIVRGHARITAAHDAGVGQVPAALFPKDTPALDVIDVALRHRDQELSGVEKLVALQKTLRFVATYTGHEPERIEKVPDELISHYGMLLGRKVSEPFLLRLLTVLDYPKPQLQALHDLGVSLDQMIPLLDLSAAERKVFLQLRAQTQLSAGETKKLSQLFLFARGRKTFSLQDWVREMTGATDGAGLVASLRRHTHPRLTEQEQKIAALIKRMKLPPDLRITPPENLEGNAFSCYFRFSHAGDLRRQLESLQRVLDDGTVAELLAILNDEAASDD